MELPNARRRHGAIVFIVLLFASPSAIAAVGRTPGMAAVTPDGEAAYSIPITVPPGTNGLTPALSLEYRHRVEGGLLGVGWTIQGLSQISRCRRTIAQDGPLDPALRLMRDRFCLDGQRLVVVNGVAYGAAGAEYRTEIESFARIRQISGSSLGPQSFVVETRDGRILEYGATADSRIDRSNLLAAPYAAAAWALNRIRDRSGNVIDFQYAEDTSNYSYRVINIRYNSNPGAGVPASHRIAFLYENRPNSDVDISYVVGTPIRLIVRLDRIDVFHGTTLLRRYDLTYEPALSPSGRSRLASVTECGLGGTDCFAPTTFSWQNGAAGFGASTTLAAALPTTSAVAGHQLFNAADINGDGLDDLIYAGGASLAAATIRYRLATGTDFAAEVDTGIACARGIGMPFDANGDGRSDLLTIGPDNRWRIVPGTPAGLGAAVATGIQAPNVTMDYRGADMNGDGLGDIAWSQPGTDNTNFLEVRVLLAQPNGGFATSPLTLYGQSPEQGFQFAKGGYFFGRPGAHVDFDADGGGDLILNEYETMTRVSINGGATEMVDGSMMGGTPLDMNGDGCTDWAYWHYTKRLRIRVGECGVGWFGTELLGPAWSGSTELRAHDWNADGRDDILLYGATTWQVAISNGDSFAAVVNTGIPHDGASIAHALDANGDGLADLVTRTSNQLRLRLRNGPKPDLLLAATDGFGVTAAFTYRPLTDPAIYQRGQDASWPDQAVQAPIYVASELHRSDGSGSGALATQRHAYEGLRRNLVGRGSLGFAKHTTTNILAEGQVQIEESLRQDYPFTGLPASVAVRVGSGQPVSETTYAWSELTLGSGTALRRFPYPATTTVRRREAAGAFGGTEIASMTRTIAAIDATSGVVTDETTTIIEAASGVNAGANATVRVLHAGLFNDTTNWCVGRPASTQVTASHSQAGGDPITRSASLSWDGPKCRMTQLRREPGSSQWQVTIALAYDAFGNVASRSVTGAGMATRTTAVNWGPRGQLPAGVTNPLQQSFALSWDLATGLPLSITDPNALRVAWSYDTLGRLVQETQPAGTSTVWSRAACTAGCDSRTRYQLTQRLRDSAGIAQVTTTVDVDQHDRGFRFATTQPGGGATVQLVEADARGREWRRYAPFWAGGSPPGYSQLSYDALDRLTGFSLHSAGGAVLRAQSLRHDGLTVTHVDALGRSTSGTQTAWGTPAQVVDPAGGVTRYEYDAFGNLLRVRDALGDSIASATYNVSGMPLTQSEMNSGTWTLTPNALGELVGLRDAKSQDFAFTYDLLGRLTGRTAPDDTGTLTWGASAAAKNIGRLAAVSGSGYAESYAYDGIGRLATRTITSDASYQYDYTYNAFGLPATLTYPSTGVGSRFKLAFDYEAGQPVRVRDAVGTEVYWQSGARDAAANVLDESLGASLRVISGFDPVTGTMDYRRATAGGTTVQDLAYEWDAGDNLRSRRDLMRGWVEEFRYDALDRLDDSRRNGVINLELDYDLTGNIRRKSDVCATTAPCYSYDATRKHAATSIAGQTYSYDANGNMTSRAGAAIDWNSSNLPTSIAWSRSTGSRFWYTPSGRRWRQLANYGGQFETTVYAGELMEKFVRGGTTIWRHYVPAPGGPAAVHLRYVSGAPSATRFLTRDHLGSIDGILEENGGSVASWSYAPFGHRRVADGTGSPGFFALDAISAITRDGFTGHAHLDHLRLIHMNGRVYDPQIGRFLSADLHVTAPFNSQSLNRYAYVWNNPLSLLDPSGFDPEIPCMQAANGACARITVIGAKWHDFMRAFLSGGGGAAQVASAAERDPCGQEGSALACLLSVRRLDAPANIVLSVGTRPDSTLSRSGSFDVLQGLAARTGNLLISSSPVTWLFGADPGFEWFDIPDSAAGRAGATLGNVGYFVGGVPGMVRKVGTAAVSASRRGITVLGHFPEYLVKAEQLASRRFNIPNEFRAKMTPAERWAANARFLDRLIARGDDVVLATRLDRVRPGSTLEREIQYLLERGYEIADGGWRLTIGP